MGKSFELYATAGALDSAKDTGSLPLDKEPAPVREDVTRFRA